MPDKTKLIADRIEIDDSAESVNMLFYEKGWTDGLPVIPPTEERVLSMLSSIDRDPQESIALLAPMGGNATIEKIAVNAVMAGCLPEYLPVVITAVESIADEKFGLLAVQTTTHPCAAFIVVNGPIARKLGINGSSSAFGPGGRANATIGRALRLIMMNIGGAIPGAVDKSTLGHKNTVGFRLSEEQEFRGADLAIHQISAYPEADVR